MPKPSPLPTKVSEVRRNYKQTTPNSRGALPRNVGDLGAVVKTGTEDTLLLVFRINQIKSNPTCVYTDSKPRHGKLVAIHGDFKVYKAINDSAGSKYVTPWAWTALNASGETFSPSIVTPSSRNCLREKDMLPDRLEAGDQLSGMIVLDVPKNTTMLNYGSRGVVEGGWEYKLK